jgi:hypothetical protein
MLSMTVTVHDQRWPLVTITVTRESWERGRVVQQQSIQYDISYGKAEEMVHNQLRPLVEEIVKRHKPQQIQQR